MVELEVETKVKLEEKEVSNLRKRILKIANFSKKRNKSDDYFAIPLKRIGPVRGYPKKAFRIRNDGEKYVINFKHWLKKYWTDEIVIKEEYEFVTDSPEKFLALMFDLGFKEWLKKFKVSESYIYKKNKKVNIEINKVKHLGYFMEIEYIAQKKEMKKAIKTVYQVLKELDIDFKNVTNVGYTRQLWDKGIKDKKYWLD